MSTRATYVIDGNDFKTLEEFYDVIGRTLIPKHYVGSRKAKIAINKWCIRGLETDATQNAPNKDA